MSRDDATRLYQIIPNISKAVRIAEKIIPFDQRLRKQYLRTLARRPKSSHPKILKVAKAGLLQQKVILELNKSNEKKLQRLAARNDMQVAEMADEIMSTYLKRK